VQVVVWSPGQWPIASQLAPAAATPLAQLAMRQLVLLPGYAQAAVFTPSQLPPQIVPSLVHAGRPPTGAPATAEHVPARPIKLHAAHCPPHAALQHTPSVQKPDTHWFAAPHGAPGTSFGTHFAAPHQSPAMQSESPLHDVLHAVVPQT
jgi:hypothetical protein